MSDQGGTNQGGWKDRSKDDWQEVSNSFSQLGRMVQDRFTGAGTAHGAENDVGDAMRSLGEALNRWGQQVSAAASDSELREQAGRAARAFSTAVGNAFGTMADELGSIMRGQRGARPEEEPWLTATDDPHSPGPKAGGNGQSGGATDGDVSGGSKGGPGPG